MAVNFHQPSVYALFDAMPAPLLTFAVSGLVTYANAAAKQHPGRPVETMSGNTTIKALVTAATLGKVKLPYPAQVTLTNGRRLDGQFMAGPAGLDVAFIAKPELIDAPEINAGHVNMKLKSVIALLKDEITPPLLSLNRQLQALPLSPMGGALEHAAHELSQRLTRVADLVEVFGDELLETNDRIEPATLLRATCDELSPRASAMGVRFDIVDPPQILPPIYGSRQLISRAFREVLENALVHSRKEVNSGQFLEVEIRVTLSGEYVLVSIRNRGASTVKVTGQDALRPFVTAGANETVPRLGLPLVQRIVGLHGGNIRLNNLDEDTVQVLIELPTGAPIRGQDTLGIPQAQRYARDLALLMSRRKKENA